MKLADLLAKTNETIDAALLSLTMAPSSKPDEVVRLAEEAAGALRNLQEWIVFNTHSIVTTMYAVAYATEEGPVELGLVAASPQEAIDNVKEALHRAHSAVHLYRNAPDSDSWVEIKIPEGVLQ